MDLEQIIKEKFHLEKPEEIQIVKNLMVKHLLLTAISKTPEDKLIEVENKVMETNPANIKDFAVFFNNIFPDQKEQLEGYVKDFIDIYGK